MTDDLLVAYAAADACHSTLARLLLQAVRDARNPRNGSCVRARHFLLESEELLLALESTRTQRGRRWCGSGWGNSPEFVDWTLT